MDEDHDVIFARNYFAWLVDTMDAHDHIRLFQELDMVPFEAIVDTDWNRESDGRRLRTVFAEEIGMDPPKEAFEIDASLLEVLVSLAYDMADLTIPLSRPEDCFWEMMHNLGVDGLTDRAFATEPKRCRLRLKNKVRRLLSRTYSPSGRGGLFPLRYPPEDQRDVELWYQLNEYVMQEEAVEERRKRG